MRGKAGNPCIAVNPCRITPAYAGKSMRYACAGASGQDHPRLCGEKALNGVRYNAEERITPAYAGKRRGGPFRPLHPWDHPRLCGEKTNENFSSGYIWGSPPPMRGKAVWRYRHGHNHGITPAYAGKSRELPCPVRVTRDHPRLCGEKYTASIRLGFHKGSPPPMRGKAETSD